MTPELLETIRAYARVDTNEVCGAIVISSPNVAEYFPCTNLSKFPDQCHFCPKDLANAEDSGTLVGYVHTHDDGTTPSEVDIEFCRRSRKPWWIVSPESFSRINPSLSLVKRPFAWGVQDCYTLIRDWYDEQGTELPDFQRQQDFWKEGGNPYMDGLSSAGFAVVDDVPQYGDGILMSIRSTNGIPNHAAVYVGDGNIVHHLPNRLSMVELYDGFYQSVTCGVVRRIK